jgi:TolA-binding protein
MKQNFLPGLFFIVIIPVFIIGCSGSGDIQKSESAPPQTTATELMQKDMVALQTTNDSLKYKISRLEQEKSALATHVTNLETQVNDLKAKLAAPPPPILTSRSSDTRTLYRDALSEFRKRNYDDAAGLFQKVLDGGAPKGLDDNCTYWIGECLYARKHYNAAITQFKKVFEFKWSEKKDDAQIMIANAYFVKGDKKMAREEYQRLIKKFPASPFVKRAKARLATL